MHVLQACLCIRCFVLEAHELLSLLLSNLSQIHNVLCTVLIFLRNQGLEKQILQEGRLSIAIYF